MATLDRTTHRGGRDLKTADRLDARGWPSLRRAATILEVNPSSLSRRPDLTWVNFGAERRLSPDQVLALAEYYGRRDLQKVAFDLVNTAQSQASAEVVESVEWKIEAFFEIRRENKSAAMRWLEEARATLPPDVFAEVKAIVDRDRELHPGLHGVPPGD